MKDYLVRGLVNSKNCRVFACQTTNLLEKARQEHDLWPTASAALGRMMSATLMMAAMNKNNEKMFVNREYPVDKENYVAKEYKESAFVNALCGEYSPFIEGFLQGNFVTW